MSQSNKKTLPLGSRFGRLVLKEETRIRNISKSIVSTRVAYLCDCDCGNTTVVDRYSLEIGSTRSCGCLAADLASARRKNVHEPATNVLVIKYKSRAKLSKIEWNLSVEDCISLFERNCVYCGVVPSGIQTSGRSTTIYNGIDRVNNTRGYTLDNVVSCCKTCNYAKKSLTLKEFYVWMKQLIMFQTNEKMEKELCNMLV